MTPELKIGSPVWLFDQNNRVYRKNVEGRGYGAPIYREYWRKYEIIGETPRNWLVGFAGSTSLTPFVKAKLPKKDQSSRGVLFSEEEVGRAAYVNEYKHKIAEMVRNSGYAMLREVAGIVGFVPPDGDSP